MFDFEPKTEYRFLPVISKGPFGEIPEDEFNRIKEEHDGYFCKCRWSYDRLSPAECSCKISERHISE